MESVLASVVNAVGSSAVGGGVVRFFHHVWWHMASILSLAWVAGLAVGEGAMVSMSRFFSYLGLPDVVQTAPLTVRHWIVAHPELGVVVGLLLIIGVFVHLRPWGEDWIDEPLSPAGATVVLMVLYLTELSGPAVLWSVGLIMVLLLVVKWFAQAPQAVLYAVIAPFLTLIYTPLVLGALLFSPAHAEPMTGRPAAGSRVLE